MTPYEIRLALEFHYTPPGEMAKRGEPIYEPTLKEFEAAGLLMFSLPMGDYVPTEKLHAYCESLKAVPLPRQVYVTDWPKE